MEYAEGVILGADSRTTTGKGNVVGIKHVKFQFFLLVKKSMIIINIRNLIGLALNSMIVNLKFCFF
jgi:hypothetical protein